MEYYNWNNNASKKSVEALFGKPTEDIPNVQEYSEAVSTLINEGKRNIFAFIGITDIFILVG
nr:unnamed protein product [Callosobruchus analis]